MLYGAGAQRTHKSMGSGGLILQAAIYPLAAHSFSPQYDEYSSSLVFHPQTSNFFLLIFPPPSEALAIAGGGSLATCMDALYATYMLYATCIVPGSCFIPSHSANLQIWSDKGILSPYIRLTSSIWAFCLPLLHRVGPFLCT